MRTNRIHVNDQGHRNPSRKKVNKSKQKDIKNITIPPSITPDPFLHKCLQQVYLQNLALNQQLARKQKQYNYVKYEHQQVRSSLGLESSVQQSRHHNQLLQQGSINKKLAYKSSLSSIQSQVENSSLFSEKFPIADNDNFESDQMRKSRLTDPESVRKSNEKDKIIKNSQDRILQKKNQGQNAVKQHLFELKSRLSKIKVPQFKGG